MAPYGTSKSNPFTYGKRLTHEQAEDVARCKWTIQLFHTDVDGSVKFIEHGKSFAAYISACCVVHLLLVSDPTNPRKIEMGQILTFRNKANQEYLSSILDGSSMGLGTSLAQVF